MGVIQPIERMCQDQENVIPLDVIVMNIEKCPKDVRMLYVRTGYVPASTLSPLERDLMSGQKKVVMNGDPASCNPGHICVRICSLVKY